MVIWKNGIDFFEVEILNKNIFSRVFSEKRVKVEMEISVYRLSSKYKVKLPEGHCLASEPILWAYFRSACNNTSSTLTFYSAPRPLSLPLFLFPALYHRSLSAKIPLPLSPSHLDTASFDLNLSGTRHSEMLRHTYWSPSRSPPCRPLARTRQSEPLTGVSNLFSNGIQNEQTKKGSVGFGKERREANWGDERWRVGMMQHLQERRSICLPVMSQLGAATCVFSSSAARNTIREEYVFVFGLCLLLFRYHLSQYAYFEIDIGLQNCV